VGEYSHSLTGIVAGDEGVNDRMVISPRGAAVDGLVAGDGVVGVLPSPVWRSHAGIRMVEVSAAIVTKCVVAS